MRTFNIYLRIIIDRKITKIEKIMYMKITYKIVKIMYIFLEDCLKCNYYNYLYYIK